MLGTDTVQRVRVYLRERDSHEGAPLYLVLLDTLRRHGASGATALRAVAGFGPTEQLRASLAAPQADNPPVVVEWIDRAERVARLLPALDALLPDALITVEALSVHRAVLRAAGPFPPDLSCLEAADPSVPTLQPSTPLRQAAVLIAEHGPLAVVDAEGFAVGMLSAGDLRRRAALRPPLCLWPALGEAERAWLLHALAEPPEGEVGRLMSGQPRTVAEDAPVAQAAATMVEWGFERLPLIGPGGRYRALISAADVLRAVVAPTPSQAVRVGGPTTSVGLIMQTAVPQVLPDALVALLVERLAALPSQMLVVADEQGQVLGTLDAPGLLERLPATAREAALRAFAGEPADLSTFPLRAAELLTPAPTIGPQATLFAAVETLLTRELQWLPVTDEGRLVGLIGRGALLRALAQEG